MVLRSLDCVHGAWGLYRKNSERRTIMHRHPGLVSGILQRIKDADDRGASRLHGPVMKMVEGVLKKLLLQPEATEAPVSN
jgi:hypothetical protein